MKCRPTIDCVTQATAIRAFVARGTRAAAIIAVSLFLTAAAVAAQVIAPDNGFGTVTMPPTGDSYVGNLMQIVSGFPPGSTLDINTPLFGGFGAVTETLGGSFVGGTTSSYSSTLTLPMTGTGAFTGYSRNVTLTLAVTPTMMDWDSRVPNTSPQSFDAALMRMQGQLPPADPDFDLLRITAGNDFGLPSPGHTTLTNLGGGNWNVDSFFDITYRIDFVGHPGGPFGGLSGSTTGTAHFVMGIPVPEPSSAVLAACGLLGLAACAWRHRR